jgi:lysine-N-methylase
MSLPVRHLPVLQQWDCQGCTNCCREYNVYLSDAERQRIDSQEWAKEADLAEVPLMVRDRGGWRLHHRDGHCVFLSEQGRCRIHERFGSAAKPFACRLYPFVLVPTGDHWRVGLRYSCPAAAASQGRPLADHVAEIRSYATELERREGMDEKTVPPPALQGRQAMDWPDLLVFTQALLTILKNRQDRIERRWRKCLVLASLCRQANFEQVRGDRLKEFLDLVSASLNAEVSAQAKDVPPPSWVGRVLFRMALAAHLRKDQGPDAGVAARGRRALFAAAWRFARGSGPVPSVHGLLPETTFEQIESGTSGVNPEAEQVLERYYLVKVGSLQFCGPTNFRMPFWAGLEALALTVPVVFWLMRAFVELSREQAAIRAVSIVDHPFGFSPLLGALRQRFSLNVLARRGELERLISWYAR